MALISIPTCYYQQYDADFKRDVPAEGYGGWKKTELPLDLARTAVAVMHAWDSGTREEYPGWHRAVEYIPRAYDISSNVLPGLLAAVRAAGVKLFHIVGSGDYYKEYDGYKHAVSLTGTEPERVKTIETDPVRDRLLRFKAENSFPGAHNSDDIARGRKCINFLPDAVPVGSEGVAENGQQLFELCKESGINHLIYAGFAINGCLLFSPGGMGDMQKRGVMCSAFRQAVTAIENKETARTELCKDIALWKVALLFGFVYNVDEFTDALRSD